MKYRDAVDKLHAPQALKEATCHAVENAQRPHRARAKRWLTATAAIALVVAAALCLQVLTGGSILGQSAQALAVAQYPVIPPRPLEEDYLDPETGEVDWARYSDAQRNWYDETRDIDRYHLFLGEEDWAYLDSLRGFSQAALTRALGEVDGENLVYSPVNVYMALALLTELTDGDSRQQLLDTLGVEDAALLRSQTERLWKSLYYDDEERVTHLGNSLWLAQDLDTRQDTLDLLADHYFASSYRGVMGSQALDQAMRDWANQQTGGLLSDFIDSTLHTQPDMLLVLLSTVYFRARWRMEFDPAQTRPQEFQNADGSVSTVDFMRQTSDRTYLWADKFSAISLSMGGYAEMTLILPDEGVTPEELMSDQEALDLLISGHGVDSSRWEDQSVRAEVALSMPKFDVFSDLDLEPQLRDLGVTDIFTEAADFTPLTGSSDVSVTGALHAARVMVDEEGCTATAIVEMLCGGIPPRPEQRVDFTLDRPFLFAITGAEGLPLFVGVVNQL